MPDNVFQGEDLVKSFLKAEFQLPTIVGWNRLEGRPRTREFDQTLRVQVRDALWMLTRQWQFGEFKGEDAGSPVFARVKVKTTAVGRYRKGGIIAIEDDFSRTTRIGEDPLEPRVEREILEPDLALRTQMGRYWCRMLKKAVKAGDLSQSYEAAYKQQYPIDMPTPDATHAATYAHQDVWQLYAATTGRSLDGYAFYQHVKGGGDPTDSLPAALPQADIDMLGKLATAFQAWFVRQYDQPETAQDSAWSASHLEYQFSVAGPDYDNAGQIVLVADEYHSGHLDWHSFDIHPTAKELPEPDEPGTPIIPGSKTQSFIPAPIEFAGMPNPRWWEFEDRQTDFGDINAYTTDTAKLLLMEFGLLYANDWFLVPYPLDVGSLAQVEGLAVTDVFGQRTWVPAAGSGAQDDWQKWSLYHLNQRGEHLPVNTSIFVPPAVDRLLESRPLEEVNFIRDEMANQVWAVESRIEQETGESQSGYEAAIEYRNYLQSLLPPVPPTPDPVANDAAIRYVLETSVPENWIPFIPVKMDPAKKLSREIQLQRGAMLRKLTGAAPEPIRPRSKLVRVGEEPGKPYFIHEEEVPRAGSRLTRTWQRARWYNGKVYVWQGRRKLTGRGAGASGLEFDQIQPKRD